MVNPYAADPCDLTHVPEDVAEHVKNYVADGPDSGWNAIGWDGGGHITALLAGDTGPFPAGVQPLTLQELDVALRMSN